MRKNKFWSMFCVVCGIIALAGCVKREVKNIASSGKNIICFGDSITFGYGVAQGEDYPTVLSKMVSLPVINSGIDGETSSDALQRMETDVLKKDPLLVIIEFCGNDFLEKIPLETTVHNIREMVKRAQARKAMVAIVDISSGLFLREYRLEFKKLADEEGAIFVPSILRGIITNPSMKSDFFHPNADGYKIVAHRVYREIFPYLSRREVLRFGAEGGS
jgi:acyl-CoA thioesterase-1